MSATLAPFRTRRSDYVIRKQADYGPRRWSIHYRTPHPTEPLTIARTNSRAEARCRVAQLIEAEDARWRELMADLRASGFVLPRPADISPSFSRRTPIF